MKTVLLAALLLPVPLLLHAQAPAAAAHAIVTVPGSISWGPAPAVLPPGAAALPFVAGFALATAALHLAGLGLGLALREPRGALALRAGGLGVALAGALLAWLAIA